MYSEVAIKIENLEDENIKMREEIKKLERILVDKDAKIENLTSECAILLQYAKKYENDIKKLEEACSAGLSMIDLLRNERRNS